MCRDFRSPGSESRLKRTVRYGENIPETLGARVHPELYEWLMGFPVGYTDVNESKPSETLTPP
jgi:hypothetical protein